MWCNNIIIGVITKVPTCAVDWVDTAQNSCQPRITAFQRQNHKIGCRPWLYGVDILSWQQVFACMVSLTGLVNSTGRTRMVLCSLITKHITFSNKYLIKAKLKTSLLLAGKVVLCFSGRGTHNYSTSCCFVGPITILRHSDKWLEILHTAFSLITKQASNKFHLMNSIFYIF